VLVLFEPFVGNDGVALTLHTTIFSHK